MRRHFARLARLAPSMRSLALFILGAALLTTFMAACGSPSGTTTSSADYKSDLHPPEPSPYCAAHSYPDAAYMTQSYDVDFWQPGIIAVGLVASGSAPINVTGGMVADVVGTFLQACFPSSNISVQPEGQQPVVPVGAVALAFLTLKTNTNLASNAELKTAIDAINSSDQPLPLTQASTPTPAPKYPLIDPHRIVGGSAVGSAVIVGASPDWGMNGQSDSGGFGGGSPHGPPSLVSHTPTINTGPLGSGKTVYVLDTVPPLNNSTPHSYRTTSASTYCGSNSGCLAFFPAGTPIDVTDQVMPNNAFICTSLPCNIATANTAISKHGFFVSEIIHNLAPGATIHLTRVLDDYGVGDLITLTNALSAIANNKINQETPTNVIVNLSLSIEPPTACLIPIWQNGDANYMSSGSDPTLNMGNCGTTTHDMLAGTTGGDQLYQKRLLLPLGLVIQAIVSKRFTIVAAAGNDSNGPNSRYGADLPSAFCGVYVAASSPNQTSGDWQSSTSAMPLSDFSNDPYVIGNNGATQCLSMPSNTNATIAASLAQIQVGPATPANNLVAPGEGVCSLYLHVGDPYDPNDQGAAATEWTATWSGSSFATAMVSGNLAAGAPNPTTPAWKFLEPCA